MIVGLRVVSRAKDRIGALLAFGVESIFFWQVVINVAVVTGLMPVVGIPLPLLSYGGSSMVTMMVAVGLLINVSMRRATFLPRTLPNARRSFGFGDSPKICSFITP